MHRPHSVGGRESGCPVQASFSAERSEPCLRIFEAVSDPEPIRQSVIIGMK